jgi:hypothetical protein
VSLTLMPTVLPDATDTPPRAVGSLTLTLAFGRVLQGLLTLRADVLPPVLVMLIADRLKYVVLDGSPLRHRCALIRDDSLEMTLDEEEYPPDD